MVVFSIYVSFYIFINLYLNSDPDDVLEMIESYGIFGTFYLYKDY